jgi:hypothetical protein
VAAHELVHAFGGVRTCTPHASPDGHVTDDDHDLMWAGALPEDDRTTLDEDRQDYLADHPTCPAITDHPSWRGPDEP